MQVSLFAVEEDEEEEEEEAEEEEKEEEDDEEAIEAFTEKQKENCEKNNRYQTVPNEKQPTHAAYNIFLTPNITHQRNRAGICRQVIKEKKKVKIEIV